MIFMIFLEGRYLIFMRIFIIIYMDTDAQHLLLLPSGISLQREGVGAAYLGGLTIDGENMSDIRISMGIFLEGTLCDIDLQKITGHFQVLIIGNLLVINRISGYCERNVLIFIHMVHCTGEAGALFQGEVWFVVETTQQFRLINTPN